MTNAAAMMRLDRLLANLGYGSRRHIQSFVRAGEIMLDGKTIEDASLKVALSPDLNERLRIAGLKLDPLPGVVLMMNKPVGVTCSHSDIGPLVYDLLPERWRIRKPPISTVGRLDKETSGLLLLTDDGKLLHRAISPKVKVEKRYLVTLARPLRGDEADVLGSGTLMLESEVKPLLPAQMEVVSDPTEQQPVVTVTVTEGRYHQVRRMFAALGNHVEALHRDRFGGLLLPDDLGVGQYRLLSEEEIAAIFE